MQVLQEVSSTWTIKSLVACSSSNKDTNSCNRGTFHGFSADSDAILCNSGFHWAVDDQRLRDFTSLQIAEVLFSRLSRELQVLIFLLDGALVILGLLDLWFTCVNLTGHGADRAHISHHKWVVFLRHHLSELRGAHGSSLLGGFLQKTSW